MIREDSEHSAALLLARWGGVETEHSEQSESAVGGECGRDVSRPYKLWGMGEQNKFYESDVAGNEKGEEILAADS